MKKLTEKQIEKFLDQSSGWQTNAKKTLIYKTYKNINYVDALMKIARIAVYAETVGHHPDIEYSYDKIKVKLNTHDAGGVTKLDTDFAHKVEEIMN